MHATICTLVKGGEDLPVYGLVPCGIRERLKMHNINKTRIRNYITRFRNKRSLKIYK